MMATRSDRHVPRRSTADERGVQVSYITGAEVHESGAISIRTRGSRTPFVLRTLGVTAAAEQLTGGLLSQLHIKGGTWTSIETLRSRLCSTRAFMRWLGTEHGIFDLQHPSLSPDIVWMGVLAASVSASVQRNLRTFLADIFIHIRSDGQMYREYLHAHSLAAETSHVQGYAPDVADAIESVARRSVGKWYVRHQEAVSEALGGLPDNWLRIDAALLVPNRTDEGCPPQFEVKQSDLAAAMVLLALIDNEGPNLATIQSYTCDSVERAGDDTSFVTGVKARNRQILRTPAPAGGLYSYGGLLEFVTAATRVDRLFRQHSRNFDGLLFVATGATRVVNGAEINKWWSNNSQAGVLPGIPSSTLSFRRLRKAALLRGRHRGHGVIGQSAQTTRLYLKDAVPDVILIPGLLNTQSSVADHWRMKTAAIAPAGHALEGQVYSLAQNEALVPLLSAEAVMDVGVAACASNGRAPDGGDKPCGLGPAACFVCPNGYRIPEVIPGLLAMVDFTEDIRRREPQEWVSSEAPLLNRLAKKALAQFPSHLVSAVSKEEISNSRVLIACVYLEGRSIA